MSELKIASLAETGTALRDPESKIPLDVLIFGLLRSGTTLMADLLTVRGRSLMLGEPALHVDWHPRTVGRIHGLITEFGIEAPAPARDQATPTYLEYFQRELAPRLDRLNAWGIKEVDFRAWPLLDRLFAPRELVLMSRDLRDLGVSALDLINRSRLVFSGTQRLRDEAWILTRLAYDLHALRRIAARHPHIALPYEDLCRDPSHAQRIARRIRLGDLGKERLNLDLEAEARARAEKELHGSKISERSVGRFAGEPAGPIRELVAWIWQSLNPLMSPLGSEQTEASARSHPFAQEPPDAVRLEDPDWLGPTGSGLAGASVDPAFARRAARLAIARCIRGPARVIDIGCGTPALASLLAPGSSWRGFDVAERGPNIQATRLDGSPLPDPGDADLLVALGVLDQASDPQRLMAAMAALARPMLLSVHTADDLPASSLRARPSREELSALCAATDPGFEAHWNFHGGQSLLLLRPGARPSHTDGPKIDLRRAIVGPAVTSSAKSSSSPAKRSKWLAMASAHHRAGRLKKAIADYQRHLESHRDDAVAWSNLGVALRKTGSLSASSVAQRRAVELKPRNPAFRSNLGNVLRDLDLVEESIDQHREAVHLAPEDAGGWQNLAGALRSAKRLEEGLEALDRALRLDPKPSYIFDRSMLLFHLGRYPEGWKAFEKRWQSGEIQLPPVKASPWRGESFDGRSLLVLREQGFGDFLFASRFLPQAVARGGRVVVQCRHQMERLFAGIPGIGELWIEPEPRPEKPDFPPTDLIAPLMSLPGIFGAGPAQMTPPLKLTVPEAAREKVAQLLDQGEGRFKVGIIWSGSVTFKGNRQRATTIEPFLSLARIPDIQLYSLQKGPRQKELIDARATPLVIDADPFLDDFADTAALVEGLDLVIMTDSSVAHLAGTLGRPIWNLLPFFPYWLYGPEGEDCPWYPSMRLFRQPRPGDWQSVFEQVREQLRALVGGHGGPSNISSSAAESGAAEPGAAGPRVAGGGGPHTLVSSTGDTRVRRCRHGLMAYSIHDQYIGRSLDVYGESAEMEVRLLLPWLKAGHWVVDAGAFIGTHAVPLARRVGEKGRVLAFEPQPTAHRLLVTNLSLNGLHQARAVLAALSDRPGEARLSEPAYDQTRNFGGVSLLSKSQAASPEKAQSVRTVTLDSLGLERCDLIKADVEGMELDVLRGAAQTIERYRPILYLENDRKERSQSLLSHLFDLSYRIYWHLSPLFHEENFAGQVRNLFPNIYSINLLCVPSETPQAVQLPEVGDDREWWQSFFGGKA